MTEREPPSRQTIHAGTRVFALLGDPVSHSLSPVFQNAAVRAAGLDAVYVAIRCARGVAPALVDALARAGGGGNVTLPHKQLVLRALEVQTSAVERTGACNTFWLEGGKVCGDNTDVAGFHATAKALVADPAGARVLLLGAGGAARAVACALLDSGASRIDVLNRTRDRAEELRLRVDTSGRIRTAESPNTVAGESFDLVVNATSLGLREGDPEPFDLSRLARTGAVIDLVYRPGGSAWAERAAARGIAAADGLEMLLQQGAAAFERWWAQPAPLDAMRFSLVEAYAPHS